MTTIPEETENYRIEQEGDADAEYGYKQVLYEKETDEVVMDTTELQNRLDIDWDHEDELLYAIKEFAYDYFDLYTGNYDRDEAMEHALLLVEKGHTEV